MLVSKSSAMHQLRRRSAQKPPASARVAGAAEIVVTDLYDEALTIASRMGATEVVNVRTNEPRQQRTRRMVVI
jgi:hypothetical protein